MNDMERRNFEDAFKNAFENAEKSPGENVWTNIELELERAEKGKIKRTLFFYQMVAAASVSFALLVAGMGYYTLNSRHSADTMIASREMTSQSGPSDVQDNNTNESSELSEVVSDQNDIGIDQAADTGASDMGGKGGISTRRDRPRRIVGGLAAEQSRAYEKSEGKRGDSETTSSFAASAGQSPRGTDNRNNTSKTNTILFSNSGDSRLASVDLSTRALPALYQQKEVSLRLPQQETLADPVQIMLQKLNDRERELAAQPEQKKKRSTSSEESLWTSVGFAAGGYNAGNPSISQSPAMASSAGFANAIAYNNSVNNQAAASGFSYSFGMVVGKRVSGRWVVQSGISYMNNSTDYTANQVIHSEDFKNFKAATLTDLRSAVQTSNNVLQTAEHNVNSSLEYVSIPVQAGFIALDRKIGLQFNAGIATDLFIQNTINPEGSSIQSTQVGRGSDSPYRSTNFSGLMNTELSYRIAARYRFSLNPGLRYPLNSIYKETSGISANPLIFDVGVRFRYIFQ